MRHEPTKAEHVLWQRLRGRRLAGLKFRRQHQFGPCILDFFCAEQRLAIELDGSQHLYNEAADQSRTQFLNNNGIRVVRFSNAEVLEYPEGVLEAILAAVRSPHPGPLPEGEGEELP
jgi:very-short-patch-repair endonuclease